MDIDEVIRAVPTFTPEEQERILDAIKASRSLGGTRVRGKMVQADIHAHVLNIMAGFASALKRKGMDNTTPAMATAFSNYPQFTKQAMIVGEWVQKQSLNVGQQRKLIQMMSALLRDDLADMGLAVTMRLMMTHVHRMQGVFARSFPGYAEAKLISLILNAKENPNGG